MQNVIQCRDSKPFISINRETLKKILKKKNYTNSPMKGPGEIRTHDLLFTRQAL